METAPDRYEVRAQQLEEGQARRYAKSKEPENFMLEKHEVEVQTLITMFRKASRTYQEED